MKNILIIQPWFTAKGHPAQSLLNTARTLSAYENINYLISSEIGDNHFSKVAENIAELVALNTFSVSSPSLKEGTMKALWSLFKQRRVLKETTILFLDGHLVIFSSCWLFLRILIHPKRIGLLYLKGPERIDHFWVTRKLITWALNCREVRLYLRTEELRDDWIKYFPKIKKDKIRTIPSFELTNQTNLPGGLKKREIIKKQLKFGIIGQIRRGKGLEWLVPFFQKKPEIGQLTVAGTFYDESEGQFFPQLHDFDGFRNEFLAEEDMLRCAMQQDYLLMLYDNWDSRMESAVLYLAARAGRPVITYNKGWCGRKVSTFDCGLLVTDNEDWDAFFCSLPRPESNEYNALLEGVEQFVQAHSGDAAREEFLRVLLD